MKWEYKVIRTDRDVETVLNVLGAKGWELINIHFYSQWTLFFKKPVVD